MVLSAPERVGQQQPRSSRFAPYRQSNPGPPANNSAARGSGNPWQPPQRLHAVQRSGQASRDPQCDSNPPPSRPSQAGWGGGSCNTNNSSRRVTSAPVRQPNDLTRHLLPGQRPPRQNAFSRDQSREHHNQEARRAVAVNTWQSFMRDRILTLGYFVAGNVWLRSNTFQAGRFSQQETEEHEDYARWCRDTILGFER